MVDVAGEIALYRRGGRGGEGAPRCPSANRGSEGINHSDPPICKAGAERYTQALYSGVFFLFWNVCVCKREIRAGSHTGRL